VFLVDTSVWIDYLRDIPTESVEKFQRILDEGSRFGITSAIFQEVLQGAESDSAFARLQTFLGEQIFYHPQDPVLSYAEAARIYARCRRVGITIRSTIDCLIARIAIEHGLLLLHSDKDFDWIATVVPDLEIY
jgi:predicted nucleic acid-binding protein